ncbi:MAG: PAS domain-containing protein, partial [Synechococcaceae cyanobacterium RL_1_2]|nr:PAS domain-containing protein [Synechococcaceae cyanobacterium RL_1_2]
MVESQFLKILIFVLLVVSLGFYSWLLKKYHQRSFVLFPINPSINALILAIGLLTYASVIIAIEDWSGGELSQVDINYYVVCFSLGGLGLSLGSIWMYVASLNTIKTDSSELLPHNNTATTEFAQPSPIRGKDFKPASSSLPQSAQRYLPLGLNRGEYLEGSSLEQLRNHYQQFIERSPIVIYCYSLKQGGLYYSNQVESYFGYSPEYLYEHPHHLYESIHPNDLPKMEEALTKAKDGELYTLEYRIKNKAGEWVWISDFCVDVYQDNGDLILEGISTDITARKRLEEELQYQAIHDPLTNLPTRVALMEHIDHCIQKNKSDYSGNHGQFALLLVDLDEFKLINDSLGHSYGDKLLVQV